MNYDDPMRRALQELEYLYPTTEYGIREKREREESRRRSLKKQADRWASDPDFFFTNKEKYLPTMAFDVYKVIALSVGINPEHECCRHYKPDSIPGYLSEIAEYCNESIKICLQEFSKRCNQIAGNIHDQAIKPVERGESDLTHKITLDEFLKWAEEKAGWSIHDSFPRIEKVISIAGNDGVQNTTRAENREITAMQEPKTKDDWFYAIKQCILDFEAAHEYTPNEAELWIRLKTNPPTSYGITTTAKGERTLAGDSPLDREAFGKRYRRLYPPNSDKDG